MIGLVVLRQVPTLPEALGILAVVLGLTMRTRDREPRPEPLQACSTLPRVVRDPR